MDLRSLLDTIYPTEQATSPEELVVQAKRRDDQTLEWETRVAALSVDEEKLNEFLAACKDTLEQEQRRQQSVDARLTTIIGLSSIASTVVFGTLLSNVSPTPSILSGLIFLTLAYLLVQLVVAIRAGIRGLERRSYAVMSPIDLLPAPAESTVELSKRRLREFRFVLAQNQDQNNEKVTQMAIAHAAMRNFVHGLTAVAALAAIMHIVDRRGDAVVDRLKSDQALREVLRGPQGPAGPQGPVGPPGPMGPRNDPGESGRRPRTR